MRRSSERFAENSLFFAAFLTVSVTIFIFIFMLMLGLPLIKEGLFRLIFEGWNPYSGKFGILPMIVGSVAISFFALFISFPLSLGCASLITIGSGKMFSLFMRRFIQMMTGIPTVVYSFVALFLLVPVIREFFYSGSGLCILSASIMLSILIAPTMILIFVSGFSSVPKSYILAMDAMGGGPVHRLFYVILPCSRNAIIIGTILGLGRAIGDTLIPLMLAGNAVHIPGSILDSARTLTSHIALVSASDFDSLEFRSIFAAGLVLYIMIAVIVAVIQWKVRGQDGL